MRVSGGEPHAANNIVVQPKRVKHLSFMKYRIEQQPENKKPGNKRCLAFLLFNSLFCLTPYALQILHELPLYLLGTLLIANCLRFGYKLLHNVQVCLYLHIMQGTFV